MGYRIKNGETLQTALQRISLELLETSLGLLNDPTANRDVAIHEVRKGCKKVRAVLWLIRDEIDSKTYRSDALHFRNLSALVAPARDSYLTVLAVQNMELPAEVKATLLTDLKATYQQAIADAPLESVVAQLQEGIRRVESWSFKKQGFGMISPTLKRMYKRGKARMKFAYRNATPENFHEWRKHVKYLRYHLQILQPTADALLGGTIQQLDELGDVLGRANDLYELKHNLFAHPQAVALEEVLNKLESEQLKLYRQAWAMGQRAYAEGNQAFVERMREYWNVWVSAS